MVYFLFEHDTPLRDCDKVAISHTPLKAAPATPRHQLKLDEFDTPGAVAASARWKPHLLPPIVQSDRMRQAPATARAPPERAREHPHHWRDAVIHAKSDLDA